MPSYREASSNSRSHLTQLSSAHSPLWASFYSSRCPGFSAHVSCLLGLSVLPPVRFLSVSAQLSLFSPPILTSRQMCPCFQVLGWKTVHHLLCNTQPAIAWGRQDQRLLEKSCWAGVFPLEVTLSGNATLQVPGVRISTGCGGLLVYYLVKLAWIFKGTATNAHLVQAFPLMGKDFV